MKNDYKFWILWESSYPEPPKKRFYERSEVEKVADKMAMENPDKEFFIMEVVGSRFRSKSLVKPKFGKKGPPPEVAPKVEKHPKSLYDTYRGWRVRGRQVVAGSKSVRFVKEGGIMKGVFHFKQTTPVVGRYDVPDVITDESYSKD